MSRERLIQSLLTQLTETRRTELDIAEVGSVTGENIEEVWEREDELLEAADVLGTSSAEICRALLEALPTDADKREELLGYLEDEILEGHEALSLLLQKLTKRS